MNEELRSCPFCNGSKNIFVQDILSGSAWQYYVSCLDCGSSGPKCGTEEEAIQAWNKRDRAKEGAE